MQTLAALTAIIPVVVSGLTVPIGAVLGWAALPFQYMRLTAATRRLNTLTIVAILSLLFSAHLHGTDWPISTIGYLLVVAGILNLFDAATPRNDAEQASRLATEVLTFLIAYRFLFDPGDSRAVNDVEAIWKWSIGVIVSVLALLVASSLDAHWLAAQRAILVLIAVVSITLDYRELGLIAGLCFALSWSKAVSSPESTVAGGGIHFRALFRLILAAVLGVIALLVLLRLTLAGAFGEEVAARTANQLTAAGGNLISGARTETPLSIAAILMSPLVGWGNAQALPADVFMKATQLADSMGHAGTNYLNFWIRQDGFVSLHSSFLQAWVEGGVLATLPLAYMLALFGRSVLIIFDGHYDPVQSPPALALPALFLFIISGVDMFFSPWTSNRIYILSITVLFALQLLKSQRDAAQLQDMRHAIHQSDIRRSGCGRML